MAIEKLFHRKKKYIIFSSWFWHKSVSNVVNDLRRANDDKKTKHKELWIHISLNSVFFSLRRLHTRCYVTQPQHNILQFRMCVVRYIVWHGRAQNDAKFYSCVPSGWKNLSNMKAQHTLYSWHMKNASMNRMLINGCGIRLTIIAGH